MKGLRPASVRSYRDGLRLFLAFVAAGYQGRSPGSTSQISGLSASGNSSATSRRNAAITSAPGTSGWPACTRSSSIWRGRYRRCWPIAERVAAIPMKRTAPAGTLFLEREEVQALFAALPTGARTAGRDRALLWFLYNTGARVQEVVDLRWRDLDLASRRAGQPARQGRQVADLPALDRDRGRTSWPPRRSPGDARARPGGLHRAAAEAPSRDSACTSSCAVTRSGSGRPGSKRRHDHSACLPAHHRRPPPRSRRRRQCHPRVVGHVSLDTTNRYAEINIHTKEAALRLCEPPTESSEALPRTPVWRTDDALLAWLNSL